MKKMAVETWVIYALVAFSMYFLTNLLMKFVSSENPLMVSLILYSTAAISMFLLLIPNMEFSIATKSILIAILIGVFSVSGTIFALKSINISPNPGYSVAIFSSNFVLIAIISIFAFGSSLTLSKALGILATLLGLILLSI